jgi:hypothetical protein
MPDVDQQQISARVDEILNRWPAVGLVFGNRQVAQSPDEPLKLVASGRIGRNDRRHKRSR